MFEHELKNAYIGYVRTPWSNTIAYFPFEEDQLDHSGSYTLDKTWTQQTLWFSFSLTNSSLLLSSTPSTTKTTSCWLKIDSFSHHTYSWQAWLIRDSPWCYLLWDASHTPTGYCYLWDWSNEHIVSAPYQNWWNYLAKVVDTTNNKMLFYLNWTKYEINSINQAYWNMVAFSSWSSCSLTTTLSELILADRERTATDVADYYNSTKSKYWIS